MWPSNINITLKNAAIGGATLVTIGGLIYIYTNTDVFGDRSEPVTGPNPSDPIVEQLPEREIEFDPVDVPLPPTSLWGNGKLDFSMAFNLPHPTAKITWNANETFDLIIGDLSNIAGETVEFPVAPESWEGIMVYQTIFLLPEDPCYGTTIIRFKVQYNITGEFIGYPTCSLELVVISKFLEVAEHRNSCQKGGGFVPRSLFFPVDEVLVFYPYRESPVTSIKTELYTFAIRGLTVPTNAGCSK